MKDKINIKDLLENLDKKKLVRIVLEEDFDSSKKFHKLENYFRSKGIVYYFDLKGFSKESDYEIDLNKLEIIY
jgi:hypothetical protein